MRVAVTGTPGTGKTTATRLLEDRLGEMEVVHLNDVIEREELYTDVDAERDSVIADLEAIRATVDDDDLLVESHLAHHLPADRVVVLRCRPERLEHRLRKRGESPATATENAESEALDVILSEAVDRHGLEAVFELDTTDRSPAAIADEVEAVVAGEKEPSAGEVDFTEWLL